MSADVGVVVPAYRPDVDALRAYVDAVHEAVAPAVLRVELDAPAPDVAEAVRSLDADVHISETRRGKGQAITDGFEALDTAVLAFADADGSTAAHSLGAVVDAVRDGADLAVGSRRHPDATVDGHQSFVRRRFGDGFARLARVGLDVDVYDFQCGAKALTAETWSLVRSHLYESGFAWDFELLAVANTLGCSIAEVPVEWQDHPDSTVPPLRTTLSFVRALGAVRHRTAAMRGEGWHSRLVADRTPLVEDDDPSGG